MQFHTIKDVLVFWRESHSAMPLTWFAKRVGVSSSTLQRIFDGTTKLPDFATSRSICLNALNSQNEAIDILKSLYPDKKNYLTEDAKSFKEIEKFNDTAVLSAYSDFYKWQLLCLTSVNSVPLKQVEELGRIYVKKAQELVKDGLLINHDNNLTCKITFGHFINGKLLVDTTSYIARSLQEKSERGEADTNGYIYFDISGLSEAGKLEARRALLECSEKLAGLKKMNTNCGNLPVSIMMAISDLI